MDTPTRGARRHWRGHPITWDGEEWRFVDTGKPTVEGYGKRPCIECGEIFHGSNHGDADPCLGNLPGVDNACCGHGVQRESYVRFTNGVVLEGFKVVKSK